jgi:ATP-binding cassette subfamily B (MDR/TAP) protein 1
VVRGLVGDRLSLVTQTLALIAISFAIGFALNWRLAFVILATYPLIVASSVCQQVMLKGFAIDASKNYEQSSQVSSPRRLPRLPAPRCAPQQAARLGA